MKWFEIKRQPSTAKRRRLWNWKIALRVTVAVGVIVGAGFYGYETGLLVAGREIKQLNDHTEDMARAMEELERYNLVLAEAADRARSGEEQWRRRYLSAVAGQQTDRAVVIARESTNAPRLGLDADGGLEAKNCEPLPDSKSVRVQTPVSDADQDFTGFDDNRVVVSAYGISAVSPLGVPLGWFDPKEPVSIKFVTRDGRTSVATRILPVSQVVKTQEAEYRFTLNRGKKGFIRLVGNRCVVVE